jgi:T5SS/PEP-CTERM-associated repeat protein
MGILYCIFPESTGLEPGLTNSWWCALVRNQFSSGGELRIFKFNRLAQRRTEAQKNCHALPCNLRSPPAKASNAAGWIGYAPGSTGTATISSGSCTNAVLFVGLAGAGTLNVTGGSVSANGGSGTVFVANRAGSSPKVDNCLPFPTQVATEMMLS